MRLARKFHYRYCITAKSLQELESIVQHAARYQGQYRGIAMHHREEGVVQFNLSFHSEVIEFEATLTCFGIEFIELV